MTTTEAERGRHTEVPYVGKDTAVRRVGRIDPMAPIEYLTVVVHDGGSCPC
jgi:hypothetical protein